MKPLAIVSASSLIGCLIAAGFVWPERVYISTAVLVEAPTYPLDDTNLSNTEKFMRFSARVNSLSAEVLSHHALPSMIEKLNLYPEESRTVPMQDLIERCRDKDISISSPNSRGADTGLAKPSFPQMFKISFRHKNPQLAQTAVEYLAGSFLTANIRQSLAAVGPVKDFLNSQTAIAEREWISRQDELRRTLPVDRFKRRRAELDAELAKVHYFHLREETDSVGQVPDSGARSLGPRLELLDSAFLPDAPKLSWWPTLGWWAGVGFALGILILSIPFLSKVTLWQATAALLCGTVCAMAAAGVLFSTNSHGYKSRAIVGVIPGANLQSLILPDPVATDELLLAARLSARSRMQLTNIISNHALYPELVKRMPMQDVASRMLNDIAISPSQIFGISFQYWGPSNDSDTALTAQKIAQELTSRIMAHFNDNYAGRVNTTFEFLKEEIDATAKDWAIAMQATGPNPDRLALDIELARKRYVDLKQRAAAASLAAAMVKKQAPIMKGTSFPSKSDEGPVKPTGFTIESSLGPHLEIFEPASLPSSDLTVFELSILTCGPLFGIIAGLIWKRPRSVRRPKDIE